MVDWTPELVERVRTLWEQWVPAKRIALLIGQGATKNTIIGKAHRKGWTQRQKSPGKRKKRRKHITPIAAKRRSHAVPRPPRPKPEPPPPPPVVLRTVPPPKPRKKPGTYTLLDLRPHECKWPVNSPPKGSAAYFFCGEWTFGGTVYCEYHARVGYQKGSGPRQVHAAAWVHKPRVTG